MPFFEQKYIKSSKSQKNITLFRLSLNNVLPLCRFFNDFKLSDMIPKYGIIALLFCFSCFGQQTVAQTTENDTAHLKFLPEITIVGKANFVCDFEWMSMSSNSHIHVSLHIETHWTSEFNSSY